VTRHAAGPRGLERRIRAVAEHLAIPLEDAAIEALARHAAAVLEAPHALHLTAIRDPGEFVDRHVGEALQGAARIDPAATGVLLDLGSGNGYPGLPIGFARPALQTVLVESAPRKAHFLQDLGAARPPGSVVLERQVQRAADLADFGPVRVLVTRAMGGWERIVPRLRRALAPGADVLVWAGAPTEAVARRTAWSVFDLRARHALEGRDLSWIWHFTLRAADPTDP